MRLKEGGEEVRETRTELTAWRGQRALERRGRERTIELDEHKLRNDVP